MKWSPARIRPPVLDQIRGYDSDCLRSDVVAGLSVAAVSLPSAIAYPAIAGLPIQVGLFAAIFSMLGYALLGPSRRLMVGPDTGTCIMLAGVLASLGAVSEQDRINITIMLTLLVGVFCFLGGALRLGFIANFLSRPMLVGFLAGISISLILGQIKRLTGVDTSSDGLFAPIVELVRRIDEIHVQTLVLGLGTLAFLRFMRHWAPFWPAPLLAVVIGIALSFVLQLQAYGVAVLGTLPPIEFSLGSFAIDTAPVLELLGGALAIMLVSFGAGIVTARSFAMKNHDDIDANKEFFGFGAANIASGIFGGFPVTASDSRTAVNTSIGGKTQISGLIASGALAASVMFVSGALSYLPTAVLGAILVSAAIDLIDIGELRTLRRISPAEFIFALLTALCVIVVGVLQGVFIAIAATLAHLLWSTTHPRLALLGRISGAPGLYKLHRYADAKSVPGLTIVMLQSALVFFNADFVKRRLIKIANATKTSGGWFVLDASAVNLLDATGVEKLEHVRRFLADRGIAFGISDLNTRSRQIVERSGLAERIGKQMLFPTAEAALAAYDAATSNSGEPAAQEKHWPENEDPNELE